MKHGSPAPVPACRLAGDDPQPHVGRPGDPHPENSHPHARTRKNTNAGDPQTRIRKTSRDTGRKHHTVKQFTFSDLFSK